MSDAKESRFFLDRDNDGHWYLVANDYRDSWQSWVNLPDDDERGWEAPPFAKPLGGSPSRVTFTNPETP